MPIAREEPVLRFIRKLAVRQQFARLPDRELLERFVNTHEQEAIAALVSRHGAMVYRVCLQVLDNEQDAEDAFQATFLVLSRKGSSVKKLESVGSWLFGVANHTATNLKRNLLRRRSHEGRAGQPAVADPLSALILREAQAILNEELARLPERYRAPLLLCSLEGLTRDEAAQQLGLRLGTLKSRLEQARKRLRVRLASRGLTLSGTFVASVFSAQMPSAAIPEGLLTSTARAATLVVAGRAATSVVSAKVAALTEGVVKTMLISKLKIPAALLLSVALIGTTGGMLTRHVLGAGQPDGRNPSATPAAKKAKKPKDDKDLIQGSWKVISADFDGQPDNDLKDAKLIVGGDKFTLKVTDETKFKVNPALSNFGVHVGSFELDPGRNPKEIDLSQGGVGPFGQGTIFFGIYALDGDNLKLCINRHGDVRPTEFNANVGTGLTLVVLKREREPQEPLGPASQARKNDQQAEKVSYKFGEIVQARFFLKNAGKNPIQISYPRLITQSYYKALRFTDNKGQEIPIHQADQVQVPVGWLGVRLPAGGHAETYGLSLSIGDGAAKESAETVLRAKPGQTCHVQYTLPNYGDSKAGDLQTGEFTFTVIEKGAPRAKQLTADELKKHIAWGKPGKGGLQVGVLLLPVKDGNPTSRRKE